MKLNKFLLSAGIAAAAMATGACTGDLDLLPGDPRDTTATTFAEDPEAYLDALVADVFFQFATYGVNGDSPVKSFDGGMATYQRAIFICEEIPTDEACWLPAADLDYGLMQYGIVDATNKAATGAYDRFNINNAICVDFLRTLSQFDSYPELADKVTKYRLMVESLWGANYYYYISCYGNIPYADETCAIGLIPEQLTQKEVYERVAAHLEKTVAEWKSTGLDKQPVQYGYIGIDVAQATLVRLYLNARAWGAAPAWDKCLAHAKEIIARHQGAGFRNSGLAPNYSSLFANNNSRFSPGGGGINENIWAIVQAVPELTSWANGTFMTNAWLGEVKDDTHNCVPKDLFNMAGAWKCMVARTQLVDVFDWNDADCSQSDDARVRFWVTSAQGFSKENPTIANQDHYGDCGYVPLKYTNWSIDDNGTIDVAASGPAREQLGNDAPMIRLAEVYLSAAEAILNGAGSKSDAVTYVNYIRGRAGLADWSAADLTAESLQQERQRELYTECTRRTDLIRYGKWVSGYTWNWKNYTAEGSDFNDNFRLYPLPSVVVTDAGYKQNPGY